MLTSVGTGMATELVVEGQYLEFCYRLWLERVWGIQDGESGCCSGAAEGVREDHSA